LGLNTAFKIGELAKRSGRSVHAIRWYEAQGLIPNVDRDGGGRRTYIQWHADWLQFLGRLKNTGMSIKDMQRYAALIALGEAGLGEQERLLRAHRDTVEAQMQELEVARALIDRKLKHYSRLRGAKARKP
jgi:DNA-binding transcriptional MerR regulator